MARRGENIRKRKDGRWEGRIKKENADNKKTYYKSVYAKTYKEVKEKMKEISSNNYNKRKMLFSDVLKDWLFEHSFKIKESTLIKYENLIENHIKRELGNYYIENISSSVINEFINNKLQKEQLKPSYVKSIVIVINSALNYAVNKGIIAPSKISFSVPKSQKKEIKLLKSEDYKKLNDLAENNNNLTLIGVMITLHTGLRIGEICALKWQDIDLDNKIISVKHTVTRVKSSQPGKKTTLKIDNPKTTASLRDIPIDSQLCKLLFKAKQQAVSEFVVSKSKQFVSPRTYEYRFHQLLKSNCIEQINYHVLRHTFATHCIEVGIDVKTVSDFLGHTTVATTLNTYVHSSMKLKRIQIEKLLNYN